MYQTLDLRRPIILLVAGLAACGQPSIESSCEDVAVAQCETCFSCGDGAELCQLPGGTSQEACVATLQQRCSNQGATLERPKRDLADCRESIDSLECAELVEAAAQGLSYTTEQCRYFL